jgi:Site-specific recombinase XerD
MTFNTYLQQLQFSTATVGAYNKQLEYFIQWLDQEQLSPTDMTYTELLDFIRWLQAQGKSKSLVRSQLCILRHYFNYLVAAGKRTDNPAAGIFIRGLSRKPPSDLLSVQQLQQLYDQYNIQLHVDLGKKIMLGLLVYQGLTTDEIERLEAPHIRLKEGKIFIQGTSRSNERWLKLEAVQVVDLQRYLAVNRFKAGALLAGQKKGFTSANNIINQVNSIMRQLRRLNPKVQNAQQLRSSVIAGWIKQYNLRQVQYMAGHKYVSSTQRYQTSDLEDLQRSLRRHHPMG